MKRLVLVAGLLVLLFAVGSFAMQGSAQDDAVPVLQTQVADLQTRVAALEGESATPVVTVVAASGKATLVSGNGDETANIGQLDAGTYTIRGEFSDSGVVTIRLVSHVAGYATGVYWQIEQPGERWEVVAILPPYAGTFTMEVHAVGDWTITIEPTP